MPSSKEVAEISARWIRDNLTKAGMTDPEEALAYIKAHPEIKLSEEEALSILNSKIDRRAAIAATKAKRK